MKREFPLSLLLVALLAACGDDVTNSTTNVTGAKTVADLSAAGKCDSSALGELVLNAEDGGLYVCNGKEWISMKGEGGESGCDLNSIEVDGVEGVEIVCGNAKDTVLNGAKGDKGNAGAPGDSGTSCVGNKIAEGLEIVCDGVVLDTLTDGMKGDSGATGPGCSGRTIEGVGVEITCGDAVVDTIAVPSLEVPYRTCGRVLYDTTLFLCDERDSSLYATVRIGNQTWMKENLNFDYKIAGESFGNYCYRSSADSCAKYGRLYTWAAAMDTATTGCGGGRWCNPGKVQGVCPDGWHLPSESDWDTLKVAVGGYAVAGTALKTATGWYDEDENYVPGTNSSGFSALPSGRWASFYGYGGAGKDAAFWSAMSAGVDWTYAEYVYLAYDKAGMTSSNREKWYGYAVRCVKNED